MNSFIFEESEEKFLQKALQEDKRLMVRSSGIEDTTTAANAGGNVTIANVYSNKYSVQFAIRQVVASYFGVQSIKNRFLSGEDLSATPLCLPVLIQVMIGEKYNPNIADSDIPISGVAFTTKNSFSAPGFPVTEINAAYGHGEGVVGNRVTTDRYYVTPSRIDKDAIQIYPMLFYKQTRLVPGNNSELTLVKNSTTAASKSVLSADQITKLYTVLKKIEQGYNQPMDVEFIIIGTKIYIVQARPTVYKSSSPSYSTIENIPENVTGEVLSAISLVSGGSQLLVIDKAEDIIVTQTLDEADQTIYGESLKAVVVSTWASSLSHAAVNFMSRNIPCLYIQDINKVKRAVAEISPLHPLIVDVQRNCMFQWQSTTEKPESFIKQGWFQHPIDRKYSLFMDTTKVVTSTCNPIPLDTKLVTLLEKLKIATTTIEQKNILKLITECVTIRLTLTKKRMQHLTIKDDFLLQQAFVAFAKQFDALIKEFNAAIEQNATHFEILFYHKMVEALCYQIDDSRTALNVYTYSYFLNELFTHQNTCMIMKKFGKDLQFTKELAYAQHCPTKDISNLWGEFLLALERYAQKQDSVYSANIGNFKLLLAELDEIDCLPMWFATSFYQALYNKNFSNLSNADKTIMACAIVAQEVGHYNVETHKLLQNINEIKKAVTTIESQQFAGFPNTKVVQELAQQITEEIVQPLTNASFLATFAEAPFIVKMIVCNLMNTSIDTIDATIKAIKISNALSLQDRIIEFKNMLDIFNSTFRTWAQHIMPVEALQYHPAWPLNRYLERMERLYTAILDRSLDESMFQRSPDFSVNAAMLGSGTAFARHYPSTAEDIFMLIHQNALVTIAATLASLFQNKPLSEFLLLPEIVLDAVSYTENNTNYTNTKFSVKPQRIGIQYTVAQIALLYNIPLNNHSATFQITYNQITNVCAFAVQFLGEARERWEQIALLATMSHDVSNLDLENEVILDIKAGIVSWAWVIKNKATLPIIIDYVQEMAHLTFENDLTLDVLISLYRGGSTPETAIKRILTNYIRVHGRNKFANQLLSEVSGVPS